MHTFEFLQVASGPGWVGPTIAVSLAVIALSVLGVAAAGAIAALRLSRQAKKIVEVVDGLQDDVAQTLKTARQLTEQAQDLMVLVRQEVGAFAQTARRLRRKVVRGVDRIEERLHDLESLYNVVHDEVEDTALDVAAALRTVRRGNGMLGRVRRLLVAGRR
jgi:ABC-type transporter Mla subunit MlaD